MNENPEERAKIVAERRAATGIDEALIETLVHRFYARVREDELIGPVFAAHVTDWDAHLARMCQFWSSVTLASQRYHGQPMQKHRPLPIAAAHFDRWLELFRKTAREVCPPRAAEHFIERGENIARSLEMGIAFSHGVTLGLNQRYEEAP
ncbi:MAG: group III truncated hemoglobin [Polyangia bacterium]